MFSVPIRNMLFTSTDSIQQFLYISLTSNSPHSSHQAMASQYGQHRSRRWLHTSDGSPVNNGNSQNRPASDCNQSLPAANTLFTSLQHFASCQHSVYITTALRQLPTLRLHHYSTSSADNTLFTAILCLCQTPTFCLHHSSTSSADNTLFTAIPCLCQPQHSVCSNTRPLPDTNLLFAAIPGLCQTPTFCLHHCPTFPWTTT